MDQIPVDLILSEESIRAGLGAMERIHGRHLASMSAQEQEDARGHWRAQVEDVLSAVRSHYAQDTGSEGGMGRAIVVFADAPDDQVEVGATFIPDINELPNGDLQGTNAQLLALTALDSLAAEAEADGEGPPPA